MTTFSLRKYFLVITTLPACSFPSAALATNNLIIPGVRIGKVSIGETTQEVHRDLGSSDFGDAAMGHSLETWLSAAKSKENKVSERLDVYSIRDFSRNGEPLTVRMIRVTSSAFVTTERISTGRSLSEIERAFKGIKAVAYYVSDRGARVYVYDAVKQGLAFEVELGQGSLPSAKNKCIAIVVHEKGEKLVNGYLPFHPILKPL